MHSGLPIYKQCWVNCTIHTQLNASHLALASFLYSSPILVLQLQQLFSNLFTGSSNALNTLEVNATLLTPSCELCKKVILPHLAKKNLPMFIFACALWFRTKFVIGESWTVWQWVQTNQPKHLSWIWIEKLTKLICTASHVHMATTMFDVNCLATGDTKTYIMPTWDVRVWFKSLQALTHWNSYRIHPSQMWYNY